MSCLRHICLEIDSPRRLVLPCSTVGNSFVPSTVYIPSWWMNSHRLPEVLIHNRPAKIRGHCDDRFFRRLGCGTESKSFVGTLLYTMFHKIACIKSVCPNTMKEHI